jgi:hypothetical protein
VRETFLKGFTRFEAAPTSSDGDIEDVSLAVDGAPISRDADWLPAIEQFGEGLFVHFDEGKIRSWLGEEPVNERDTKLIAGFQHWSRRFGGKGPKYPGLPYVLLHSLSHALMSEIALDCGYPASALKERVYALPEGDRGRFGILIYTATAGAQGTLGAISVERAAKYARSLDCRLRVLPERCNKKEDRVLKAYYNDLKVSGQPFDATRSEKYRPLAPHKHCLNSRRK